MLDQKSGTSDIEKFVATLKELGIQHVRRNDGDYEYIFIGECRNIVRPDLNFKTSSVDELLNGHNAFEFENGKLASYPNS